MTFWESDLVQASNLDAVLDKEDITLEEVMQDSMIRQDLRAGGNKLVDLLVIFGVNLKNQ